MSDILQRLRAYAAANPTDVQVVRETIRQSAELDALAALRQLSLKWMRRQNAERRADRAVRGCDNATCYDSRCARPEHKSGPVRYARARTLRGFPIPQLEEEPFLLTRRVTYARTR